MSSGWGTAHINAISELAEQVNTAYKNAPNDYKRVAEEVQPLQTIINKAALHFGSSALSNNDKQDGQEVLEGCQGVLRNLNALIEKYQRLASTTNSAPAKTSQVFKNLKLGIEDIATLREKLRLYINLLNDFVQRFYTSTYYYLVYYANCSFTLDVN